MKLPIASWKRTLRILGYRIIKSHGIGRSCNRGPNCRRKKYGTGQRYQLLEPRQLLAAAPQIQIVDRGPDLVFEYELSGQALGTFPMQDSNLARGAATTPDGSTMYVIDARKNVLVYDTRTNAHVGTWRANGLRTPQGIATDGEHIWIVDKSRDQVLFFAHAADNRWSSQSADGRFDLQRGNRRPTGITTDGETVWVVDDKDRVYVYDTAGNTQGIWRLDFRNGKPTGIAIDPSGGDGVWVVDERDDRVYFYANGRDYRSGYRLATSSFRLDSHNKKAEGIAIQSADVAPAVPVIESVSEDSGFSDSDGLTNDSNLSILGTGDPGSRVTVSTTSLGSLGSATVDESGHWEVDATSITLPDGTSAITAVASLGSQTSGPSATFELTVDTTAPVNLAVRRVDLDSGLDDSDGITNDNQLVVSGVTEAHAIVTLFESSLGELGTGNADSEGNWTIDLSFVVLPEGTHVFRATATDRAGNTTLPSSPMAIVVDTAPPVSPMIFGISDDTGLSLTDGVTRIPTQTIAGTAEPNTIVTLTDAARGILGAVTSDSSGAWSIDVTFSESNYHLSAVATDPAGNPSEASSVDTVVVDQTSPFAPVIDSFDTDSGQPGDRITNDDTLIFEGMGEPESTIDFWESTLGNLGSTTTDAGGHWTLDLSGLPLVDGSYLFSATSEDLAGNVSPHSQQLDILVDTLVPGMPLISRIDDDTGMVSSDQVTSDNTLDFMGISAAGATVHVFESTFGLIGTAVADSTGSWYLDATSRILPDGRYAFSAVAIDAAGNRSPSSLTFEVQIDTVAPIAATITGIDADTGAVEDDGITNDTTLLFRGTAESGAWVTLLENVGGIVGMAFADESGKWQIDATDSPLVNGSYRFTVASEDLAGNPAPMSFEFPLVIDTIGPTRPSIVQTEQDTGRSDSDGVTSDQTLTLMGIAEPDSTLELFEAELGMIGTSSVDESGVWHFDMSPTVLADGIYAFSVIAQDRAGNNSEPSLLTVIEIDTQVPIPGAIISIDEDTGENPEDAVTHDNTLVFNGIADPDATVTLVEDSLGVFGSVTADSNGNWQIDATSILLADGNYRFSISSEDVAGNIGPNSELFPVIVDTARPNTPSIHRIVDDRGFDPSDRISNDNTLVFLGMAPPRSTVYLSESILGLIGHAITDDSGIWTLDATSTVLPDGNHEFTAFAEDAAGNLSPTSAIFSVEVDTIAPARATIAGIDFDSGALTDDGITNDRTLEFSGTSEPYSVVTLNELTLGILGQTTANETGSWQYDATHVPLADREYRFTVDVEDPAGNIGVRSDALIVTVDTSVPTAPSIFRINDDTGASDADNVTYDNTLNFVGLAEPGATIRLFESTLGLIGAIHADADGVWRLDASSTPLDDGEFVFTATAEDLAGNVSSVSQILEVVVDTIQPIEPMIESIDRDTGISQNDAVTHDETIVLQGHAEELSWITVSDPVLGIIGEAAADADGDWIVDLSARALADGTYRLKALSTDLAGNTSQSMVFQVTIDTLSPDIPIIIAIDEDTGSDPMDGVTYDPTLTFTGRAEPDMFIRIFDSISGLMGSTRTDTTGTWQLDLPSLAERGYEFTAMAEDLAGNLSDHSQGFAVVVDSTAPQTPTLDLDSASDTAPVGDQTTDKPIVTLIGMTDPGVPVVLSLGMGPVDGTNLETVADANGNFTFREIDLVQGANPFIVAASDLAGNVSLFSQTIFNSSTDADPPEIAVELLNDTGLDSNDQITTDPTLIGSVNDASPLAYVDFYLFSPVLGSEFYVEITSKLDGSEFVLDPSFLDDLVGAPLPFGQYYYTVDAEDIWGNYGFTDGEFLFVDSDQGDTTPPEVSIELLNDTGPSSTDRVTSDGSLMGTVIDQSPVSLTVSIADFEDLESGNQYQGDVTDLLQPDGSFTIPQERLETILGQSLERETYCVTVEANDQFNVGGDSLNFDYILLASPPVITTVVSDTGLSDRDGITRDRTLTITGHSDASVEIELFELSLGSLGTTTSDDNGDWIFSLAGSGLVDGVYEFTAIASTFGESSGDSNRFLVTIDTESPLRADFDLAPDFDTGVIGDGYTTMGEVTLQGTTLPNAQVRLLNPEVSTIANSVGAFEFPNVHLDLGRRIYEVVTTDLAGNESIARKSIAFDQPITLMEDGFVTEATQLIGLGQDIGTRTVSFHVDAQFGSGSSALEDSFAVYLVDPASPASTLLDRGIPGTSLFSMIGKQADYLPGRVRFDGSLVQIDVSSLAEYDQALLRFQLIDNDGETSTTVSISNLASIVDVNGNPSSTFFGHAAAAPGIPFDTDDLHENRDLSLVYENIRYDQSTHRYTADMRVQNEGVDLGNRVAVLFPDLAPDVSILNASGSDANGVPYVSLRNAIPNHGLLAGEISDAVRIEFLAPAVSPLTTAPIIVDGGPNVAPILDPIEPINVAPGAIVRVDLSASAPSGQGIYFSIRSDGDVPNTSLTANGQLIVAPGPEQIGSYEFEVVATDGMLASFQPVAVNVVEDPVTTTRISGYVLDTHSVPLAGIPVELGGTSTQTADDGSFSLAYDGPLPGDTLIVHGESYGGPGVYPFIAEKLPLLYGHEPYENVNNQIERPIYLPALDVANGVSIDPSVDVTVTTPAIPGASVFVAAGSLETQDGGSFTGKLSITEVPADFTPAALPPDQFPDMVVTIQPGEMVFTTPAPLDLPNLAGYLPGTEMTLWSINPNTGLFDDVGVGVVSADGATVQTVAGGINNSSWHFFGVQGPVLKDPSTNPRNLEKACNDCEHANNPNDDNSPKPGADASADNAPLNTDSIARIAQRFLQSNLRNPSPAAGSGGRSGSPVRTPGLDGGWGTGGTIGLSRSADFGPYGSWGGSSGATVSFGPSDAAINVTPTNTPLLRGNDRNAKDTSVALHSGAVYKSHDLTPYQSLGQWHGLRLTYDSERADARPIISTGFNEVQNNLPDPMLVTKLTVRRGNLKLDVPGFSGVQSGLTGGEHFFLFPSGASSLDVAIQADMRALPTGAYEYESTNRFAGNASGSFTGTASVSRERFVHVNSIDSPFGAGWGISGLLELVENPDGSVLLVDGDGGELLFESPLVSGEPYVSPAADFSTLIRSEDGRFRRIHANQTVERFGPTNKLTSITDRNGNMTEFRYNADDSIEFIIDPVGLTTIFRYLGTQVAEIENPAGVVTTLSYDTGNLVGIQDGDFTERRFDYDSLHRLTGELDKLGQTEKINYGFSGRIESVARKDGSVIQYAPVQTQGLARPGSTSEPSSTVLASDFGSAAKAEQVDGNGNVTQLELDKQGQRIRSSDSAGSLGSLSRNQHNLVERSVDGRGNLTLINHDERGNVVSLSDAIARGAAIEPVFSDPVYPLVPFTDEFVTADVNGDGFQDVISESGSFGDGVTIYLGDGAGGFHVGVTTAVANPVSLGVGDFNADGFVDVVTTNREDQIYVLLSNGNGTLQDPMSFPTGTDPEKVQVADFNLDGHVDLVTSNSGDDSISILLGDGTGQFPSFTRIAIAHSPRSMALGDINGDFFPDILVASAGTDHGFSVVLGGSNGFEPSNFVSTPAETEFIDVAELTGDGRLDVITGDADLLILSGHGDGTFGPAETIATGSSSGSSRFIQAIPDDVDFDGDQDLIFSDSSIAQITVFENNGSGAFALGQTMTQASSAIVMTDVNSDGNLDILTLVDGIVAVVGRGDGTFVQPPSPSEDSLPAGDQPTSLASGDFDNDGHQDLAIGAQLDNTITVMLGTGDGSLTPLSPISTSGRITSVATADLDRDGNADLVTSHDELDIVEIRFGDGTGAFEDPVSLAFPSEGPLEVKVGDFNNDGELDLATVGYDGSNAPGFAISLNNGDRTFATGPLIEATFQAGTIDVGDLNADGNLDVVVGVSYFSSGNAVRPFFGNGDGTFVDQGRIPFGGAAFAGPPQQLKLIDLDQDGDLDIVGVDKPQVGVKILLGSGNGTFEPVVSYRLDSAPRSLDVGDINNDGALDVIATNFESNRVSVLFGNGDGSLGDRRDFVVGQGPAAVQLVDLDEDGSLDFVTADSIDDAVSFRINSTALENQAAEIYEYDAVFNQLVRSIDEEGRLVFYEIDPTNGNRLSMTQVIGELGGGDDIVTSYTYTPHGLIDTVVDPLGRVTEMEYNDRGLLAQLTFAVGSPAQAHVNYEYDAAGNQTAFIDELGHRTEYTYDAINRILQVIETDPDGSGPLTSPTTTNVYDEQGNVIQAIDALGNTTQFFYDAQHRLVIAVDANLATIRHEYDLAGNLIATTDRLGRRTEFNYDQRNRLVEVINAEGGRTNNAYDGDNNLVSIVDANGVSTQYTFDTRRRLIRTTDPLGRTVQYRYDRVDNLIAVRDELGRRTEMHYDELNRVTQTLLPDPGGMDPNNAPTTVFVYDAAGNVVLTTDALGNSTEMQYDDRNRMVRSIQPDPDGSGPHNSPQWINEYDDANRLIRSTDPLGRATEFVFDDLNRLTLESLPDPDGAGPQSSPQTSYTYDSMGNRQTIVDALGNRTEIEYDDLHRIISTSEPDPDGAGPLLNPITQFVLDAEGQVTQVVDPLGRTTTFVYDRLGRVISESLPDPDGAGADASPLFTRQYDHVGNEVQMTDALGNTTNYVFDDNYRLVRISEPDPDGPAGPATNPTTEMKYDAAHQLISVSDPLNRVTEYKYDDLGRLILETFPDPDNDGPEASPTLLYSYDLMNNVLFETDALGNATSYTYDHLHRLTSTVEADPDGDGPELNPVTSFEYDVASQLISTVDALGRITAMEYDALGRLVRRTEPDPDGAGPSPAPATSYVYDLMNNRRSATDALGNTTTFDYDNLYRLTKTEQADPDGSGPQTQPTMVFQYDIAGQLISASDPLNRRTSYVYDALGRVTREISPDPDGPGPLAAPELVYAYDLMDNLISTTDAVGNTTQNQYDTLYRLTGLIEADPDGTGPLASPITRYGYDLAGQLLTTSDPLNRTTSRQYDGLGRLTGVTQPDPDGAGPLAAPESHFTYDLVGNQVSSTDPLGHETQFQYDHLYRRVREISEDPDAAGPLGNPTTTYTYDLEGNLLSLTDTSGNQTSYVYDALDRKLKETIELGDGDFASRQFEYDLVNNLIRREDRNGRIIEFDYDAIYRMIEERWLTNTGDLVNTIEFEFDEASQILRAEDLTIGSRYDYSYDDLGRVIRSVAENGGPGIEFISAYDSQNRVITRESSVGGVKDFRNIYFYDSLNRVSRMDQVSQPGGRGVSEKRIEFQYNADDQLTRISRFRDVAGGANDLVMQSRFSFDQIGRLTNSIHSSQSATIVEYDWIYDAASRITQLSNSIDGSSDFEYDHTNQLASAVHANQVDESYQYDEEGNRSNGGFVTGIYNRLISDGVYDYEYDREGNRIERTDIATGEVAEYEWDHRNRLTKITSRNADGDAPSQIVLHRYDVFNRWISKTVDVAGTSPPIATRFEYDADQIVLAIDDAGNISNRYTWGPGSDQLLVDDQIGDQVYWAATDHLGSVRDVVDSSGTVVTHIVYDSFGNIIRETDPTVNVRFGFTGRPLDDSTGLQNNLNRWYDASVGRWASEDPIAFQAGDSNLYRYVGNRTTTSVDPEGLDDFWNSRLGVGLSRIYNQPLQSARVFVDPVKRSFEKTKTGRFGLELGETTLDIGGTLGKAMYLDSLPYLFEDFGPAVGELATIQGAKLAGKPELAERIRRNSRFSQTRDLERYIAQHGAVKARAMLEEAVVYADIAAHVYEGELGSSIQGFNLIERYDDQVWKNSGFQAGLYYNSLTGKYVLAYEGTNPALTSQDGIRDICQDLKQGFGRKTEQYELAINLAKQTIDRLGGDSKDLTLTGHSLGGGLATAAALVHNIPAYVIDPAGVHPKTLRRHGTDFARAGDLVDGIRLYGEFLTTFVNTAPGAAPTQGNIHTIPATRVHDPFSGHSSALVADYIRELLKTPKP